MILTNQFNKDKLFFTSDLHFYHKNIIDFCSRPFENVQHMNEMLIVNWNAIVEPDADVIIAGDFIFSSQLEMLKNILDQLNGNKILVLGNHDYQNNLHKPDAMRLFQNQVYDAVQFKIKDSECDVDPSFYITHYPCEFWKRDAIHLYGHVHSGPKSRAAEKPTFKPLRYDIGVDNNNYTPVSYSEIIRIITKQMLTGRPYN